MKIKISHTDLFTSHVSTSTKDFKLKCKPHTEMPTWKKDGTYTYYNVTEFKEGSSEQWIEIPEIQTTPSQVTCDYDYTFTVQKSGSDVETHRIDWDSNHFIFSVSKYTDHTAPLTYTIRILPKNHDSSSIYWLDWEVKVNVIEDICTDTLNFDKITINDDINSWDIPEFSQQTGVNTTIPGKFFHSLYQTDTNDT